MAWLHFSMWDMKRTKVLWYHALLWWQNINDIKINSSAFCSTGIIRMYEQCNIITITGKLLWFNHIFTCQGLNSMINIYRLLLTNAYISIENIISWYKFYWIVVKFKIKKHWFRLWIFAITRHAIIWTNFNLDPWCFEFNIWGLQL